MNWQDWYTKYAKYYHVLDGASINYPLFAKKLDEIFKENKVKRILDFACGIGKLDIELTKLGYEVKGVDLNNSMLNEAISNSKKEKVNIEFLQKDLRRDIVGKFDAVICTYNYIGHFSKEEFIKILHNLKENLKDNGIIFFDIFNFKFMKKNFKESFIDISHELDNVQVERMNNNRLDKKNRIMRINQTTKIEDKTLGKRYTYKDTWDLKIYTLEELKEILSEDFKIIKIYGSIFGESMLCPYSDDKECVVILAKLKN